MPRFKKGIKKHRKQINFTENDFVSINRDGFLNDSDYMNEPIAGDVSSQNSFINTFQRTGASVMTDQSSCSYSASPPFTSNVCNTPQNRCEEKIDNEGDETNSQFCSRGKDDCDYTRYVDIEHSDSSNDSCQNESNKYLDSSDDELINKESNDTSTRIRNNLFSFYDRRRRLVKKLKVFVNKLGNVNQQGAILADVLNSPDMAPVLKTGNILSAKTAIGNHSVVKQLWKQLDRSSMKNSVRGRVNDDCQSYRINSIALVSSTPDGQVDNLMST